MIPGRDLAALRSIPLRSIAARYVARGYLGAAFAALVGMTTLVLVIDFADRAKIYSGPGWLLAVAELYACKLAMTAYQIAPAAAGLAAAVAISALRQRSEVTALRSLGHGVGTFAVPLALCAALLAVGMTALEDRVVVPASYRAEEITTGRFNRWGDWASYHRHRRWFRGSESGRLYYLGRLEGAGFSEVAVYEVDDSFGLRRRIDAARIEPVDGGRWRYLKPVVRTFDPASGDMREERFEELEELLPDDLGLFRLRTGRPSQLRRDELPEQIALRQRLGLPSREWELSLHERRAYQLTGIPSALLGMALALRPGRRGHLTTALGEGLGVTVGLWSLTVLAKTLTLAGHLPAFVGGWLPLTVAAVVAVLAVRAVR